VSAEYLASGSDSSALSEPLLDAEIARRLDDTGTARRRYEEALASEMPDALRAQALEGLGQIAVGDGNFRAAIDLLERARELGATDPARSPALYDSLARAYGSVGELAPAIALLEEAVEWFGQSSDAVQYVRFAAVLACALTDRGDFQDAERVLARALTRGRGLVDPISRARLYWSQSRLLAEQGQPEGAERYARLTVEILRATEDDGSVVSALHTLAHICTDRGRPQEALELLAEGEQLLGSVAPAERAQYRLEEARARAASGDSDRAGKLAMEVAGLVADLQPVLAGRAYLVIAQIFEQLGDRDRARELCELAVERAELQAPNKVLVDAYKHLAGLLKAEGRRDEALDLLERALTVQERFTRAASI
jgi:tetratricopeptide (TPR) repeat protein